MTHERDEATEIDRQGFSNAQLDEETQKGVQTDLEGHDVGRQDTISTNEIGSAEPHGLDKEEDGEGSSVGAD